MDNLQRTYEIFNECIVGRSEEEGCNDITWTSMNCYVFGFDDIYTIGLCILSIQDRIYCGTLWTYMYYMYYGPISESYWLTYIDEYVGFVICYLCCITCFNINWDNCHFSYSSSY